MHTRAIFTQIKTDDVLNPHSFMLQLEIILTTLHIQENHTN